MKLWHDESTGNVYAECPKCETNLFVDSRFMECECKCGYDLAIRNAFEYYSIKLNGEMCLTIGNGGNQERSKILLFDGVNIVAEFENNKLLNHEEFKAAIHRMETVHLKRAKKLIPFL